MVPRSGLDVGKGHLLSAFLFFFLSLLLLLLRGQQGTNGRRLEVVRVGSAEAVTFQEDPRGGRISP